MNLSGMVLRVMNVNRTLKVMAEEGVGVNQNRGVGEVRRYVS
jgi:hypothetical protein